VTLSGLAYCSKIQNGIYDSNPITSLLNLIQFDKNNNNSNNNELYSQNTSRDDLQVCVVVGCGPVGLLTVALTVGILTMRGYTKDNICVYAIDTIPERLEFAKNWGAIPLLLNTSSSGVEESALSMTVSDIHQLIQTTSASRNRSGCGADIVLECVGTTLALKLAFDIAAPGSVVSSIGVHSNTPFPYTPSEAYDKNLTYRTGRCPARSLMSSAEYLLLYVKEKLGKNVFLLYSSSIISSN
jgi:threonine dehydrogenase-like Zn-dependent dehydrogenase